jgi:hypothetical protein
MQSVLNMQRAQSGRGVMNDVHHDREFGDCDAVAIYRAGHTLLEYTACRERECSRGANEKY